MSKKESNVFMAICLVCFCMSIASIVLSLSARIGVSPETSGTVSADGYITCTLENGLEYKVKPDWKVDGITNAIIFYLSDSSALSISCEPISSINQTSELKCTYDTLADYVKTTTIDTYAKQKIEYEIKSEGEYPFLDTKGYRIYSKQITTQSEQKVNTYTDTVFFIYKEHLCSVSFTSSFTGYPETEFDKLLESIQPITENTSSSLKWGTSPDSAVIEDFTSLIQ